jgi:hypothetical protein
MKRSVLNVRFKTERFIGAAAGPSAHWRFFAAAVKQPQRLLRLCSMHTNCYALKG